MKKRTHRFKAAVALFCAAILLAQPALAAISLIRDEEIERTLKDYSYPIFETAGLIPESIRIFIVGSNDINAFVAGGANIFVNTGLIKATKTPSMLIGVIAHETGHISGGHLPQGAEKMRNAQLGVVLGYILGAAAAATGSGDAAGAIMSSSQHLATRNLLSFTRANEQAADQAAVRYLDKLGISASGMVDMFETLKKQEDRRFGKPDPYALTHPLSKERIAHMRGHVERSTIPVGQVPEEYDELHRRMVAKLVGFTEPLSTTLSLYPLKDQSLYARYARAIAYYRVPDFTKAISEIDSLLKESPIDPYFNELKAQILFESGKVKESLGYYEKALKLLPDATLIRVDLAKAQLAQEDPRLLNDAISNLQRSTTQDNANSAAWRLLASAYGKRNEMGLSYLALAEESLLKNDAETAEQQAKYALGQLSEGSPSRLRAEDIIALAKEMRDK